MDFVIYFAIICSISLYKKIERDKCIGRPQKKQENRKMLHVVKSDELIIYSRNFACNRIRIL